MNSDKINQILLCYKNKVDESDMLLLMNALKECDDSVFERLIITDIKDPITTLLLSVFLGAFGVDRFYINDIGLGVAKLLLGWLTLGIWPLIDIFCAYKATKRKNIQALMTTITMFSRD